MKASLFCNTSYLAPVAIEDWPVTNSLYDSEIGQQSLKSTVDRASMADDLGYDWVSVAEHHFSPHSITPNPMVMAGALTQVVKKAKIALLGPDIPILNPLRVAEEFAMLDTMTNGRVVAGMMRATPQEYVTYNINPNESRGRFNEGLELIKMAWTEREPFGWQGRYFEYRSISIWPRPVQSPHPPIYMSGSSQESGKYAAANRIGIGFAATTLPLAVQAVGYYRAQAREFGWEPTPDDVIYRCGMHVAETDDQANDDVMSRAGGRRVAPTTANWAVFSAVTESGYQGHDPRNDPAWRKQTRELDDRIELGQIIVGSPETVIKQIKNISDQMGAGILEVSAGVNLGDKTLKSIELFGEKVLPHIRNF